MLTVLLTANCSRIHKNNFSTVQKYLPMFLLGCVCYWYKIPCFCLFSYPSDSSSTQHKYKASFAVMTHSSYTVWSLFFLACTATQTMDAFYEKISDPKYNGATFFAVCRGKVQYRFCVAPFSGLLCFQFVISVIY